jgi:hypothetical protein
MKSKIVLSLLISLAIVRVSYAQDVKEPQENQTVIYTFLYNKVPENFKYPLIGFFNMALGNQENAQLGFINTNQKDLNGFQAGFANSVGGNLNVMQAGFVNSVGHSLNGFQLGYVNTVGQKSDGFQLGFVNSVGKEKNGFQAGFVNSTGSSLNGFQSGFVNITGSSLNGFHLGFVNSVSHVTNGIQFGFVNNSGEEINGTQSGFVNTTRELNGLQLGFVNIADTVKNGIPIGFVSIVKNGGYKALEISANEIYPFNIAWKIGLSKFYTSINFSYNKKHTHRFASGLGLGTIIPLTDNFSFNPELISQSTISSKHYQQSIQLVPSIAYHLGANFNLHFGPSLVWHYNAKSTELTDPAFSFFSKEINNKSKMFSGLRLALRYEFTGRK